ncbi:MAG: FAD:protein FMN transferase [Bacteroidales bacterium]|jgi:thiamine biosynthesis lipoprotein|nr:FAD:protein FMN transferase [Bacteroidales bacterium]
MQRITIDGLTQGTYFHIVYYGNSDNSDKIKKGIDSIFSAIDNSLSLWNENSVITRLNNGEDVKLDKIFIDNFYYSREISDLTDGAFDITVGGLVEAYGFANKERRRLSQTEINDLLRCVGYKKISLSEDSTHLVKEISQTKLDFNAIAQGYTSDLISDYLLSQQITSFIVDVGGEVFAKGLKPDKETWKVGLEEPAEDSLSEVKYDYLVELSDESIVTSGSYRKYYVENGMKYSHTIDTKTGKPVTHNLLSASVIAKKSYIADGLATAFMVMGVEKAKIFLETHKEFDAYFIFTNIKGEYETYATSGFKQKMRKAK